jgi:ribose transport system ATP-binding protein
LAKEIAMSDAPIVELKEISKSFPGVQALDQVSVSFFGGEVHSLMGENGAGKSTLMKILSGAQQPDSGQILIDGEQRVSSNPMEAQAYGIGMVYQELTVLENLDVGRNLLLGMEPTTQAGTVDWRTLYERAARILENYALDLDVRTPLSVLSVGEQQMVEIARVASREPRMIIMDEPTSALGREEERVLFSLIERLKEQRVAIAYVSHRLAEVFQISDRISVLRDGRHIFSRPVSELDRETVIQAMVGKHVEENYGELTSEGAQNADTGLEVENLSDDHSFSDISFSVRRGEVLGVVGLMGSGRTELFESIFGLRRYTDGAVRLGGTQVPKNASPRYMMRAGMGYVPPDRKRLGLVMPQPLSFNLTLSSLELVSQLGVRLKNKIAELYERWGSELSIRATSRAQRTDTLSGGNQQKVLLAKWLVRSPLVMVLNEPTRGVDVGAKAEVHRIIRDIADSGVAVAMISSELPEIRAVSNRVMVMWKGLNMGILDRDEATEKRIVGLSLGEPMQHATEGTPQ